MIFIECYSIQTNKAAKLEEEENITWNIKVGFGNFNFKILSKNVLEELLKLRNTWLTY